MTHNFLWFLSLCSMTTNLLWLIIFCAMTVNFYNPQCGFLWPRILPDDMYFPNHNLKSYLCKQPSLKTYISISKDLIIIRPAYIFCKIKSPLSEETTSSYSNLNKCLLPKLRPSLQAPFPCWSLLMFLVPFPHKYPIPGGAELCTQWCLNSHWRVTEKLRIYTQSKGCLQLTSSIVG